MMSTRIFTFIQRRACNVIKKSIERNFHQTNVGKCFEQGKTTATILNTESELGIMIDGYSEVGFRLNNNVTVLGSMLIFPRSVLSWSIDNLSEISDESLALLTVLEPKVDIVVIGTGEKIDTAYSENILGFMKKNNLSIEILPTYQACATFNFLNSEGRYVVGALIPPKKIKFTDDDVIRSNMRYQNIYGID